MSLGCGDAWIGVLVQCYTEYNNLLDSPRKARFYSKIDLRHTYHLIRIQEGDEWKTTFHTHYRSFDGVSCLLDLPMLPPLSSA